MSIRPTLKLEAIKLQATLPASIGFVLDELAYRGLIGNSRADVASYLLTNWVMSNGDFLKEHGITLVAAVASGEGRHGDSE
jgi:hypothetical protein